MDKSSTWYLTSKATYDEKNKRKNEFIKSDIRANLITRKSVKVPSKRVQRSKTLLCLGRFVFYFILLL